MFQTRFDSKDKLMSNKANPVESSALRPRSHTVHRAENGVSPQGIASTLHIYRLVARRHMPCRCVYPPHPELARRKTSRLSYQRAALCEIGDSTRRGSLQAVGPMVAVGPPTSRRGVQMQCPGRRKGPS